MKESKALSPLLAVFPPETLMPKHIAPNILLQYFAPGSFSGGAMLISSMLHQMAVRCYSFNKLTAARLHQQTGNCQEANHNAKPLVLSNVSSFDVRPCTGFVDMLRQSLPCCKYPLEGRIKTDLMHIMGPVVVQAGLHRIQQQDSLLGERADLG